MGQLKSKAPDYKYEIALNEAGFLSVAGADEAGRGAMAGPLVAAAVILPTGCDISGLNDSKLLSAKSRERLEVEIMGKAIAYSIALVGKDEIDEAGVHKANLKALALALNQLQIIPAYSLIDGFELKEFKGPHLAVKHGDAISASIAAASILAKVERDRIMDALQEEHPEYGFDKHKGYCTKEHIETIRRLGPLPMVHRHSFSPVFLAAQNRNARAIS